MDVVPKVFNLLRVPDFQMSFRYCMAHCSDVIMSSMAPQITGVSIVCSTVCSDQRKHQSSALLDFVRGIHRSRVNSLHKGPVTRKIFPFDDVIMRSARKIATAVTTGPHVPLHVSRRHTCSISIICGVYCAQKCAHLALKRTCTRNCVQWNR